uniref:Molybdopterin-synthase adenylyltransferase n=1 Tax=Candidatus Kentrum sp. FM TaxID=2126340 RepID=A0A450U2W4_9GAMM|nr:MAG: adenylyltransferase and sulfurtransferase [Candidatus Kentron sp. FM]VFJ77471.1 MAG: adenylyltransferase and sulfurtransferase [Candidatus Kentron sp. FM]VFK24255.1 MAG: adenylyltransferase and sulfurtransferase [Candidatus Kentron sp. FM]
MCLCGSIISRETCTKNKKWPDSNTKEHEEERVPSLTQQDTRQSSEDFSTRYSRHIALSRFGIEGQRRLSAARVLVIGMGGLGSPIGIYLAAAGVGHLVLVDFDRVELSNLQRQIVHTNHDLARLKVESARDHLAGLNPNVRITPLAWVLDEEDLLDQVSRADVVVDATDNFESRFEINRACFQTGTPLVSGAAIRMEGQVTVFDARRQDSPCYRCLYRDGIEEGESCAQVGVLSPLLGIIGSIQATETLKILAGIGTDLTGRVLLVDAFGMEFRTMKLRKDPDCPVCG